MQGVSVDVEAARRSGALDQRAYQVLGTLVAEELACEATARRVFLRMVIRHGEEWQCQPVPSRELVYLDQRENARVARLVTAFRDAQLLVHAEATWAAVADWRLRGWPMLSTWCARFGAAGFALQHDLAEATARWYPAKRASSSWSEDARMPSAIRAMRAAEPWLNARERAFVAASLRRRIRTSARASPDHRARSANPADESAELAIPGDPDPA